MIEVGTLVMLKSGGPTMTVTSLRDQGDGIVHCEWFAGNELKRDSFDEKNLTTAIIPQLAPPLTLPAWSAPPAMQRGGCAACNWGAGVCGCVRPGGFSVSNTYAGPG